MNEQELIEALNDCLERLATGQSLEECLHVHPQHAAAMRPLLATSQMVRQATDVTAEAHLAQKRGLNRLEAAMDRELHPKSQPKLRSWSWPTLSLAFRFAVLLLLLVVTMGMTAVTAANSLPGDRLYAVKRLSEQIQLSLSGHDPALIATFEQRRLDETRALLVLGREATVTFRGRVAIIDATTWLVDDLPLTVDGHRAGSGSRVEVEGRTTADGRLIALNIRLLEPEDSRPLPVETPTQTPAVRPTIRPSVAPTLPAEPTAIPAREDATTLTPHPSPTSATRPPTPTTTREAPPGETPYILTRPATATPHRRTNTY